MFKLVVLSCVLVAVAASPSALGPWGLAAPLGHLGWGGHGAAWPAPVAWAPPLGAYNYRGPLSLAPGQPASILAADGRPLDTLSVNLDRAAHITAKAVGGAHLLKKRSAPLWAPLAVSHSARLDWPSPLAHLAPLSLAPRALPVHAAIAPWGVAPLRLGHVW